ncbi:hypothetical protein HK104_010146 [Borealophlyctis nickersoniae]|nr:hypothetical protein HK104_010146 [Borealophlyctis nickersoniae]
MAPSQPTSPIPGGTGDAERVQLLQAKLAKAVQHLKHLTQENSNLSKRLAAAEQQSFNRAAVAKEQTQEGKAGLVGGDGSESAAPDNSVNIKKELSFLKHYAAQLEETVQEGVAREEELSAKVARLEAEISKLRVSQSDVSDSVSAHGNGTEPKDDFEDLRHQLEVRQTEIQRLRTEVHELTESKRDTEEKLRQELANLESNVSRQVGSMSQRAQQLMEENERLSEAVQSGRRSEAQLDARIAELQEAVGASGQSGGELDDLRARLRETETKSKEQAHELRTRLNEAEQKIEQLQRLLKEREQEDDQRATTAQDLATTIGSLRQSVKEKDASMLEFMERIRQLETDSAESSRILEEESQVHQKELAELVSTYKKAHEEDAKLVREAEATIARLREVIDNAKADADTEIQQREAEISELKQTVRTLEEQSTGYEDALAQLRGDLEALEQSGLSRDRSSAGLQDLTDGVVASLRAANDGENIQEVETVPVSIRELIVEMAKRRVDAENMAKEWANVVESEREERETNMEQLRAELQREREAATASLTSRIAELESQAKSINDLQSRLDAATEEVARIGSEKSMLLEKLSAMKTAVASKLQAEMQTTQNLRTELSAALAENSELKNQMTSLTATYESLRAKFAATATDTTRVQVDLETTRNSLEKTTRELDRLRSHLVEAEEASNLEAVKHEETLKEYIRRISALEQEREQWESAAEQEREAVRAAMERVDEVGHEKERLREELENLQSERARDAMALTNLQEVLEQFQASRDAEIEFALEGLKKQLAATQASLEEFKRRAEAAEERASNADRSGPQVQLLQQELQEKNVIIGKLRRDVIQVQNHLAEAMRRIRDAAGSDENVDRRLVTNLIVSFLAAPRGDPKRFEILSVVSNVLRFTEEEKWKVGLARKPPTWNMLAPAAQSGPGSPLEEASHEVGCE